MTAGELKQRLQITLTEGTVAMLLLSIVGLAFNAGIQWSQVSDLRVAQQDTTATAAAHVTRDELHREMSAMVGSPERLARIETQVEQLTQSVARIERKVDARQ